MTKVAAITSGESVPSSRFRIRQHIPALAESGIQVREYCPAINKYQPMPLWPKGVRSSYAFPLHLLWLLTKLVTRAPGLAGSYQADMTWLNRELLPGYFTLERYFKRPLVFDVDDATWLASPFGLSTAKKIASRSEVVIAGNSFIADWFGKYADDVVVIPTAVDTGHYLPRQVADYGDFYIVGWIGTSGNLKYLEAIEESLKLFLGDSDDRKLLVVSDERPKLPSIDPGRVIFEPWSMEREVRLIQNMHVGLMPLEDSEWSKGKCSFKMLQYMACGKPVIVSPVGMNVEVLGMASVGEPARTIDEWYSLMTDFCREEKMRTDMGNMGRKIVVNRFSQEKVSNQLAELFRKMA